MSEKAQGRRDKRGEDEDRRKEKERHSYQVLVLDNIDDSSETIVEGVLNLTQSVLIGACVVHERGVRRRNE